MQTRSIGGVEVAAIGLGAMPLSVTPDRPSEADAVRVVHAALDAGVRLVDTADAYCLDESEVGHNERLVAQALGSWSGDADTVLVATKGGHTRRGTEWDLDGRPEYLREACERSLKALGVDTIGLYQYHRPDPKVPWAESVGALADLQREGKIRLIGVSNADPEQIRQALAICDLAAVQNQFSPAFTSSLPELRLCAEQGVAFLPWSPLGGMGSAAELGQQHPAFAEVAEAHGVSPQQVALAWELTQADVVIPIPGASRPQSILDSVAAADLTLSDDELRRLA